MRGGARTGLSKTRGKTWSWAESVVLLSRSSWLASWSRLRGPYSERVVPDHADLIQGGRPDRRRAGDRSHDLDGTPSSSDAPAVRFDRRRFTSTTEGRTKRTRRKHDRHQARPPPDILRRPGETEDDRRRRRLRHRPPRRRPCGRHRRVQRPSGARREAYTFVGVNAYEIGTESASTRLWGSRVRRPIRPTLLLLPPNSLVRFWAFQDAVATNVNSDQLDWAPLDRVFAAAAAHGQRLIVTLTDQGGRVTATIGRIPRGSRAGSKTSSTAHRTVTAAVTRHSRTGTTSRTW